MRVLGSQLTREQIEYLENESKGMWKITAHTTERMVEKGVNREQIMECLKIHRLVQFQREADSSRRILVRDNNGTCLVLDIDHRIIVTAFHNNPNDNHRTLDRGQYLWGTVTDQIIGKS